MFARIFRNEPVGEFRHIATGAEGVAPLAIGEAGEQVSGPSHVACGDAVAKDLLRRDAVCKLDGRSTHPAMNRLRS